MRKFFENLWYHYKSYIIVFGLLFVVGIIILVNLLGRVEPDLKVIVFTESALYESDVSAMEKAFSEKIGDVNGDGKKEVVVKSIYYGSDVNTTLYEQLTIEMNQGSAAVVLCEEKGIRTLLKYDRALIDLSPYFDETCYDGRGVRLSTADMLETEFKYIPRTFVVLVRNTADKSLDAALDYLKTLVPVEED